MAECPIHPPLRMGGISMIAFSPQNTRDVHVIKGDGQKQRNRSTFLSTRAWNSYMWCPNEYLPQRENSTFPNEPKGKLGKPIHCFGVWAFPCFGVSSCSLDCLPKTI